MKFTIRHRLIQVQAPNSRKTYTLPILERIQSTKSLQEVHYKFKITKEMQSRIQKRLDTKVVQSSSGYNVTMTQVFPKLNSKYHHFDS